MEPRRIGYARVSTNNQELALQIDAMQAAGIAESDIFIEKISGSLGKSDRPKLKQCLDSLCAGDSLVVWKLDRLGRSLSDLIAIVNELKEKKASFVSLTESIDTSNPMGLLIYQLFGAFSEFEKNITRERVNAGVVAARKRGIIGGRPRKLSSQQEECLIQLYREHTQIKKLQQKFQVSKTCIYRYLKKNNAPKGE
jgi:DNA invertase Pin-like site-specific DNA recombinase